MVVRADPSRAVLTHGEPHSGNTMRTAGGWRLIDWETALLAPPERDLWSFGPDIAETYRAATGVPLLPAMLELYRLRWDICDVAVAADRFQDPHPGTADDDETWAILAGLIAGLAPPGRRPARGPG